MKEWAEKRHIHKKSKKKSTNLNASFFRIRCVQGIFKREATFQGGFSFLGNIFFILLKSFGSVNWYHQNIEAGKCLMNMS